MPEETVVDVKIKNLEEKIREIQEKAKSDADKNQALFKANEALLQQLKDNDLKLTTVIGTVTLIVSSFWAVIGFIGWGTISGGLAHK